MENDLRVDTQRSNETTQDYWGKIMKSKHLREQLYKQREELSGKYGRIEFFNSESLTTRIPHLGDFSDPYNEYAKEYLEKKWAVIITIVDESGDNYQVVGLTETGSEHYNNFLKLMQVDELLGSAVSRKR